MTYSESSGNFPSKFHMKKQDNLKQPLVLAVDDDEDNLHLITQILEIIGYPFITATDGKTTLLQVKNYQPDLILLDIMLPDISGVEITRILQQDSQTKEIPIVAVTAMAAVEERQLFRSIGCVDCAIKPYDLDELETIIHKYVLRVFSSQDV